MQKKIYFIVSVLIVLSVSFFTYRFNGVGTDNISNTSAVNPQHKFIQGVEKSSFETQPLISNVVPTKIIVKQAQRGRLQLNRPTNLTFEKPTPKKRNVNHKFIDVENQAKVSKSIQIPPEQINSIQSTIIAGGTDTNVANTGGGLFIPADPHGAAGPNHVVNTFNVSIEIYQKNGTKDLSTKLATFFAGLSPANNTFDPRVIYDQHENRWVVVTLEVVDSGSGAATDSSRILLAVSDDSNPNGLWTVTSINTKTTILNGTTMVNEEHWLDYPGLAVDNEAIYITGNMFRFRDGSATAGNNGGVRVVIVDKGIGTGGLYEGGATSASIFDHEAEASGFGLSSSPAQIYGNPSAGIGTWLVGYSGLSNGTDEAVEIIRIDNPISMSPTFTSQLVFIGDVDELTIGIPDAPQSGGATPIDSGDRRVQDAVWRNNSIYFTTEVQPGSGADTNEATAYWGQISTSGTPSLVQGATIGGDTDISPDTYTSYASIAVNADGGILVGFTASSSSMFPSTYFVNQSPTDALNSMRPASLIKAGEASYVRTFGTQANPNTNRWGDYSATVVDPDEACFWVYNKYATTQGTPTGTGVDEENGRYLTAFAHFCNDTPVANNDTAELSTGGTVTTVNGASTSLIANDSDIDTTDTLSMTTSAVTLPSNGAVTLNANGSFSYMHNGNGATTDSFVYQVCDDGSPIKCSNGTVNITILSIGSDPIFKNGFE
jgi:hypothetical protein